MQCTMLNTGDEGTSWHSSPKNLHGNTVFTSQLFTPLWPGPPTVSPPLTEVRSYHLQISKEKKSPPLVWLPSGIWGAHSLVATVNANSCRSCLRMWKLKRNLKDPVQHSAQMQIIEACRENDLWPRSSRELTKSRARPGIPPPRPGCFWNFPVSYYQKPQS